MIIGQSGALIVAPQIIWILRNALAVELVLWSLLVHERVQWKDRAKGISRVTHKPIQSRARARAVYGVLYLVSHPERPASAMCVAMKKSPTALGGAIMNAFEHNVECAWSAQLVISS